MPYMITSDKHYNIVTANDDVKKWYADYSAGNVGENYGKGEHFLGAPVVFCLDTPEKCDGYLFELFSVGNFKSTISAKTTSNEYSAENLYVNTGYRWSVTGFKSGEAVFKSEGSFKTEKFPRTINIGGVSNVRDIAFFSPKIKQGMLYRSASLDDITLEGKKTVLFDLGIKTDIDLRTRGEGTAGTVSPLGDTVGYFSLPGAYYVESGASVKDPVFQKNMAEVFKVLADENNYPTIFHCAIGRDRTGTLAAILEILLGATEKDVFADYELSFFSEAGCRDNAAPDMMLGKITELYEFLRSYGGGSVRENVEKYLGDIGVFPEEIENIKKIMTK